MMKEYRKNIRKICKYFIAGKNCFIYCIIDDVRNSFGRIEYKIEPLNGGGFMWINKLSVLISEYEQPDKDLFTV